MSPSLSSSDTCSTIIFQKPRDKKYYAIVILVLLAIMSASIAVIVMRLNRNKNGAPSVDGANQLTSLPSILKATTSSPSSSGSSNFFEYKRPQEFLHSPIHSLSPIIASTSYSPSKSKSKDIITSVSQPVANSPNPSVYETSTPSMLYTPTPSVYPSLSHTIKPSAYPSHVLTMKPSNFVDNQKEIKFYVLGDIPYNRKEQKLLKSQLKDIQNSISKQNDTSQFIVHVGDLMSASFSKCRENAYAVVSYIMRSSTTIPVLTTPGDNEWNRCPNTNLALANYTKYFIGIEDYWRNVHFLPSLIVRSKLRPENWVFYYSHVMFLAINMVHYDEESPDIEADLRLQDNLDWFIENCNKYCNDARAVIMFGHSVAGASIIFDHIHQRVLPLNIPLVYFTGNGHKYFVKRGVGRGELPGNYFWRVQVDMGKYAPPIQITIRGNTVEKADQDEFYSNDVHQEIIGENIKIDRRGGLYSNLS